MINTAILRARSAGLRGAAASLVLLGLVPGAALGVPASQAAAQASPNISIANVSVSELGTASFLVSVDRGHPALTVDYATRAGSAVSPNDFTAASGTLTIPASATANSAQINVVVVADNIREPDETFYVDLSNAIVNIADAEGEGTILNNDPIPELNIEGVSVNEGDINGGTVDAVFNVTLSNPASQDVTVNYRTSDGTAVGNQPQSFARDFRDKAGTLTFPAGTAQTQQVTVKVTNDLIHEDDETFLVGLTNPVNARLGVREATGTIVNEDPVPVLSIQNAAFTETDRTTSAILTVSLSNPTESEVTFTVSTSNGTAVSPGDYLDIVNGVGTISATATVGTVSVQVVGDERFELSESMFVIIDQPTNATLGNSVGELTIENDDTIVIGGPVGLP